MAATKQEINFTRLLNRCEVMLADKNNNDGWRIEKYVEALHQQLNDLKKSQSKPPQDTITEYSRKVDLLKGLVQARHMPTAGEKILITDQLPSVPVSDIQAKELHIQAKSKYRQEQKDELLGKDTGLRHRNKTTDENDIDTILQHHHQMQEKLADELLNLTRNLKDNIKVSGKIVEEDTKKIIESTRLSDTNYSKLKVESDKLEMHTKSCSWWIWIMLGVVMMTFLWMILFMKMFPRR
ncbi:vesicle transport protein USE1 [Patella vulgata]|uniref:vesicle transport protein USE1 n=1 Tax=Patella vulgata TaxID=6465 RepID=UPI00217F76E6|nr:vesicle transport protein USE1 [Patella vulgata]